MRHTALPLIHGQVNPLSVRCPECYSAEGRMCRVYGRGTALPHGARYVLATATSMEME